MGLNHYGGTSKIAQHNAKFAKRFGSIVVIAGLVIIGSCTAIWHNNWTNSHEYKSQRRLAEAEVQCTKRLRNSLNDPNSLEVLNFRRQGSYYLVDYSAKNGFGGRVRDMYVCG